jgi:broad specificity phosphatase PhoE
MILFMLPAANIYDRQSRVCGWRATPAPRESLKQLKGIVPRLKELGVTKVIFRDLDADTGCFLAKKLAVPFEEWHALRRLNAGKNHGASISQFAKLEQEMQRVWAEKPDVPIKGGDSLTSFKKRIAALGDKLKSIQTTAVVVADERIVQALCGTEAKLERGRVYVWHSQ